jgi:type I restriction enzyme S subunit
LVRPGDIVLERSGGTPTQLVGRVVIAGDGLEACIPTDFQRLLRPDQNLVEPRYLFWRLRRDWQVGVPRDYSKRTTNIANLSVKPYLARTIPLPPRDVQREVVVRIDEIQAALAVLDDEANALGAVNLSLLDKIFGGA